MMYWCHDSLHCASSATGIFNLSWSLVLTCQWQKAAVSRTTPHWYSRPRKWGQHMLKVPLADLWQEEHRWPDPHIQLKRLLMRYCWNYPVRKKKYEKSDDQTRRSSKERQNSSASVHWSCTLFSITRSSATVLSLICILNHEQGWGGGGWWALLHKHRTFNFMELITEGTHLIEEKCLSQSTNTTMSMLSLASLADAWHSVWHMHSVWLTWPLMACCVVLSSSSISSVQALSMSWENTADFWMSPSGSPTLWMGLAHGHLRPLWAMLPPISFLLFVLSVSLSEQVVSVKLVGCLLLQKQ